MKRLLQFLTVVIALCTFASLTAAELRTWETRSGKYKVEAEFVSRNSDGTITLKRKNGKELKVALAKLSDADANYVEKQTSQSDAAKKPALEDARPPEETKAADNASEPPKATLNKRNDKSYRTMSPRPNVVNRVRSVVLQRESQTNVRRLTSGLIAYVTQKQRFPPSFTTTRDRQPGLSWRVAILPYIDEGNLHRLFKLNEPWDSPHNEALIEKMPQVFLSGGSDESDYGYTQFLAVAGDGMVFDSRHKKGIKLSQISDGMSKTAAIVEVDPSYGVIWTKPDDYFVPMDNPLIGLGHIWPNGFLAGFADGSVKPIPADDPQAVMPIFTRAAGDTASY